MHESGRMLATVLEKLKPQAVAEITTAELDRIAADEVKKLGGEPAFKGYRGFPNVLCTSVNDALVHGLTSGYALQEGDLAGLDFGVKYRGMITDAAITVVVGNYPSKAAERMMQATQQSLELGIDAVKDGVHVGS